MNGAEVLMHALQAEEVEYIFGIPGGANLPAYDAVRDNAIKHIHALHEQGAGHMATGYAKASGRVGVCFATSGPGATNLLTPIADAYMDSAPVVFITGQVRSDLLGSDAFQEADIFGMSMSVVKHSFLISDADEIAQTVAEAFYLARSGRPGPVLIDIPQDCLRSETELLEKKIDLPGYRPTLEGNRAQIRRAAEAIASSTKPVVYGGGGIINAGATKSFREFISLLGAPTTTTLMGLGACSALDPLWLGMLGMHGSRAANWAVDQADLLIAIGARFDDRITGRLDQFAREAQIIHLDVDPAEISKIRHADIPCVGDLAHVLPLLSQEYGSLQLDEERLDPWRRQVFAWREEHPFTYKKSPDSIKPQEVISRLAELTDRSAIVSSDVGQHQMWAAQWYPFIRPRQWINSGGLGTMGVGLPYAIGASLACPKEDVICISGDGSLAMTMQELATASRYDIPVKIFLLDNGGYGMVRQWQELFWDERYMSIDLGGLPRWEELSRAFDVWSRTVSEPDLLPSLLEQALQHSGPALLHIKIDPTENCWPMIPAGAAARDMIGE